MYSKNQQEVDENVQVVKKSSMRVNDSSHRGCNYPLNTTFKNMDRLNSSAFNLSSGKNKLGYANNSAMKVLATKNKLHNKSPHRYYGRGGQSSFCRVTASMNGGISATGNDDGCKEVQHQATVINLIDEEQIQIENVDQKKQRKSSLIQHSLLDRKLLQNQRDEQSDRHSKLSSFIHRRFSFFSESKSSVFKWDQNISHPNDNKFSFGKCCNKDHEKNGPKDQGNEAQILNAISFLRSAMHNNKSGEKLNRSGEKSITTPKLAAAVSNKIPQTDSQTKSDKSFSRRYSEAGKENLKALEKIPKKAASKLIKKVSKKKLSKKKLSAVLVPPAPPRPTPVQVNPETATIPTDFSCPHCFQRFEKAQALGGHVSKKHPNQSNSYNQKIQTRKERFQERAILNLAKIKFSEFYPDLNINSHRWKVTQLKSQIKSLQQKNPEQDIDDLLKQIEYKPIGKSKRHKNDQK